MASERLGPRVQIVASCQGCKHERTESYRAQGDSGCDVYCAHPDVIATSIVGSRGRIGDTRWTTPAWCPLLKPALDKLLARGGERL